MTLPPRGAPPDPVPGALSTADRAVVAAQLGRPPRGARAVAHRCPCGLPDVVETSPRLADGSPFPTLYYLTCPRAATAVSVLESAGLMREHNARLAASPDLAAAYRAAHERYLARRAAVAHEAGLGEVPEIAQVSAGGMPTRVKCLHALLAQTLAESGSNPSGEPEPDAACRPEPDAGAGPGSPAAPHGNPFGDEVRDLIGAWWVDGPCVAPPGDHAIDGR